MTAVDERIDLSWVTFTKRGGGEQCQVTKDGVRCQFEAVSVAVWDQPPRRFGFRRRGCGACCPARCPVCVLHRQKILAIDATGEPGWKCSTCGAPVRLLRLEPIR